MATDSTAKIEDNYGLKNALKNNKLLEFFPGRYRGITMLVLRE